MGQATGTEVRLENHGAEAKKTGLYGGAATEEPQRLGTFVSL